MRFGFNIDALKRTNDKWFLRDTETFETFEMSIR